MSLGETQEAFLARIGACLKSGGQGMAREELGGVGECGRVVERDADLAGVFAKSAARVGMKVHQTSREQVGRDLAGLLTGMGARHAAVGGLAEWPQVLEACASAGCRVVQGPAAAAEAFVVDVGVTDVQVGIAETGSLVCTSSPEHCRTTSLAPPVHIAVLPASRIVADLIDFFAAEVGGAASVASSVVLITGPSKTADIEGILITGVHGPREVHILLVGDA